MLRWLVLWFPVVFCVAPVAAQEVVRLTGHGGPIMAVTTTKDGVPLTASFDNSAGLWLGDGPLWLEGHAAAVTAVASITSDHFATGGDDFSVFLWKGATARLLGVHKGKVRALAVSPDGRQLASASWDGRIGFWDLSEEKPVQFIPLESGVNDVAYAEDGRLFAATMTGEVAVIMPDLSSVRVIARQGFGINKLVLGNEGRWLAYGAVDGATRVINTNTGSEISDFTLGRRPVLALAHHAGREHLAVGDGQGYIMLIDTATWRIVRDYQASETGPIWGLAFSNDGEMLWSAGMDDVLYGIPLSAMQGLSAVMGQERSFLRSPDEMSNGERQFMRKCSVCHTLDSFDDRRAGPSLKGLFGRRAGTVTGYRYSDTLKQAKFVWSEETIDALFDIGPEHYIPGTKMPMQRIAKAQDRADLIAFLKHATRLENEK